MKINGYKTALKFRKVKCPKCEMMCAMEFTGGPKEGIIQCASSDHIKPCNFFQDNQGVGYEQAKRP